jgi:hypothetical protein
MRQFTVTSSMGKRLIGMGMAAHPAVQAVLKRGTLVIVAGSTNGYVAEEVLKGLGIAGFDRKGFRRGTVFPPGFDPRTVASDFPGDVVLTNGVWQKGKTVFDVADHLKAGDLILKGGNALDLTGRQAAVLIGDPQTGTAGAALRAVVGRRVQMIVPIGLEKRVVEDIRELAEDLNAPDGSGPRLLPLPGAVYTELDAIEQLTGAMARLVAAGGIYGAEGSVWISVRGSNGQEQAAMDLIESVAGEPACRV